MQAVLFKINNSLFPGLSPQNVLATEQQKLTALQNHHSFNDTFQRGDPVPRGPLISRNTVIPTGMEEGSSLILFVSTFCFPGALHTSEHSKRESLICILYYSSSKPSGLDFQKWLRLLSAPESQSTWHSNTSENHLLKTTLYVKSLIWCLLEAIGAFLLFHSTLDNVFQEIQGIAGETAPVTDTLIQSAKQFRQKLLQQVTDAVYLTWK